MRRCCTKPSSAVSNGNPVDTNAEAWKGFRPGLWQRDVNVRWFMQQNYTPYSGDGTFIWRPATERNARYLEEIGSAVRGGTQKKGCSTSSAGAELDHSGMPPGYIDRGKTRSLLACRPMRHSSRAIIAERRAGEWWLTSLKSVRLGAEIRRSRRLFSKYRKTHNEGVFRPPTRQRLRNCRSSHILTGLPDAYGRGAALLEINRRVSALTAVKPAD